MYIIIGIAGFIVGVLLCFLITRLLPAIKVKEINEARLNDLQKREQQLVNDIENMENNIRLQCEQYDNNQIQLEFLKSEITYIQSQKEELRRAIDENLKSHKEMAEAQFDIAAEQLSEKYRKIEAEYQAEYEQVLADANENYNNSIAQYTQEIETTKLILKKLKDTVDRATEAAKREEEKKSSLDFYRLKISEQDIIEIKHLREVGNYLRDKEPLGKIIWKTYYEKPYTDLIGRAIGSKQKTGIYKITNINNQMCYIGQSLNIAERWKQHIKRGVGAEAATRNKLYPAMMEEGIENFTFELIEECDKNLLDEKEKYWQNYFNALTYGYSMR